MWLVALYQEYYGYDLINMTEGLKLYDTKREAKRAAMRLNKKMAKQLHIPVENLGS